MKKDLTIYDVQVNCARLSKEKIENLARIVKENGGVVRSNSVRIIKDDVIYFLHNQLRSNKNFSIYKKNDKLQSISYARFVEMFDKKELELRKDKEEEKTRIREELSKPIHYTNKSGYDVIDIAQDNNLNFNLGAVCKYILRAGKKLYPNMNEKQSYLADLKKAQDHLNREIEYTEKQMSDEKA